MTDQLNGRLDIFFERLGKLETRLETCESNIEAHCKLLKKPLTGWNRLVDLGQKFAMPLAIVVGSVLIAHEKELGLLGERVKNLPPRYLQDQISHNTKALESLVPTVHAIETQLVEIRTNQKTILKALEDK